MRDANQRAGTLNGGRPRSSLTAPVDKNLEQWLEWQMRLHDRAIDLGLERVAPVADRLGLDDIAGRVVTVAGTNGKGSTVAAYETWLSSAGFRVASYTSPHLLRYNERIRLNRQPVDDRALCAAFAAVEAARGDLALTYFEFGTLAALLLIKGWQPDFALLEVGLGGRLDAVNLVDADLVHLTPIGLDHQAWLGEDREQIGREKAGVLRAGIPVIVNDPDPPESVLAEVRRRRCRMLRVGQDYRIENARDDGFDWCAQARRIGVASPLPGPHQQLNLAGVLAGLSRLLDFERYTDARIGGGFEGLRVAGRFDTVDTRLPARVIVDVGHNQDAAGVLAQCLAPLRAAGARVSVLLGMLEDKRADQFTDALASQVDRWWLLGLPGERGLSARALAERLQGRIAIDACFDDVASALAHASSTVGNQDIILVTGSFVTVELTLRELGLSGEAD